MAQRLDNRLCLYGEPRLSNAQVTALRGAAADDLRRTDRGWFTRSGAKVISSATIAFLERRLMIQVAVPAGTRGKAEITFTGRELLRKIDADDA